MHETSQNDLQEKIKKYDFKKAKEYFSNILEFNVCSYGLKRLIDFHIDEINIVDVRKYEDYIEGHIPFAIHVPIESFEEHYNMFDKKKMNVVYSYDINCLKSKIAASKLAQKEYPAKVLLGGFKSRKKTGFDTVKISANQE